MDKPTAGQLAFLAVLMWVLSWWLLGVIEGEPVGTAIAVCLSFLGLAYAIHATAKAIPSLPPFTSLPGQILWALRPRGWMLAWGVIIALVLVFGRPMFLWNYGHGRCQYIDWNFEAHIRPPHGDGAFAGCRFVATR